MKTNNVFDLLDAENTVSDETVISETGVSTQRITELVRTKLDTDNGGNIIPVKKKRSSLRITALIAAVLAVSVITAAASGEFNEAFGEFFVGESSDGIYSGSHLTIESESTNVEFLGIAGDDHIASASMKLTRKDGKPFVDSIEDTWIWNSGYYTLWDGIDLWDDSTVVSYTMPKWFEIEHCDEMVDYNNGIIEYVYNDAYMSFDDCSTISAFIYSLGDYPLKGETMTASLRSLSAYTVDEILYDYSEHIPENTDEYGHRENADFRKTFNSIIKDFGREAKNGVRVTINPKTQDIVLAKETPLDIDFTLSVKMDYKSSTRTFKLSNLSECFPLWENGAEGKITVSPFTMELEATINDPIDPIVSTYDNAKNLGRGLSDFWWYTYYKPVVPEELKVTLSSGEVVMAIEEIYEEDDKCDIIYSFYECNDDANRYYHYSLGDNTKLHPKTINPDEIVSIETYGVTIYQNQD